MPSIPSPRSTSRCGEPSVSSERKKVRSAGRLGEVALARTPAFPRTAPPPRWRRASPAMFSVGRSASAARDRQQGDHAGRVVVGPGTASRAPMSANASAEPAASTVPSLRQRRGSPGAAPRPRAAGPPSTGHISGGLVSVRSRNLREAPVDRLRDRRVEERGPSGRRRGGRPGRSSVRRRPGRSRRRRCASAPRQQPAQPAAPAGGRSSIAAPRPRRRRARRRARRWPRSAAQARRARRRRWRVRAATSRCRGPSSTSTLAATPYSASRATQPLGGLALARRRARAVDRRQLLDVARSHFSVEPERRGPVAVSVAHRRANLSHARRRAGVRRPLASLE